MFSLVEFGSDTSDVSSNRQHILQKIFNKLRKNQIIFKIFSYLVWRRRKNGEVHPFLELVSSKGGLPAFFFSFESLNFHQKVKVSKHGLHFMRKLKSFIFPWESKSEECLNVLLDSESVDCLHFSLESVSENYLKTCHH